MAIHLSIIIPVYNEEKTILKILDSIAKTKFEDNNYEIIIIDDGSTDQTLKLLNDNKNKYSILIKSHQNMGKGHAVIKGLEAANGKYVVFQDADLEYDPEEFVNILKIYKKFNADIVYGSRVLNYKNRYYATNSFTSILLSHKLRLKSLV